MTINTPNPDGEEPIVKQIEVKGGVMFTLQGYRYTVRGTVKTINEETQAVYVEAPGIKAWVHQTAILDAFSPDDQSNQHVYDTDAAVLLQEAKQNIDLSD